MSPEIPLVSGRVPLVSNRPAMTIPRFWGVMPSWKRSELVGRRRSMPSSEMGLLHFLTTLPIAPLRIVSTIATAVTEQAEEEIDAGAQAERRLLQLRMRREAGEIDDEEFASREKDLRELLRRLAERGPERAERRE